MLRSLLDSQSVTRANGVKPGAIRLLFFLL